jgi:hypothetical protein
MASPAPVSLPGSIASPKSRLSSGGRPINQQNFSKWKIHGYPDWLQEQVFAQVTKDILVKQIEKKGLPPALNEISTGQS